MAEDLALGLGERTRHVERTLVQVSTFGLPLKIWKKLQSVCAPLCFFFFFSACICVCFTVARVIWNQSFSMRPLSDECELISICLYFHSSRRLVKLVCVDIM